MQLLQLCLNFFEFVLLQRIKGLLSTSDNQFGFKSTICGDQSTDMCIYLLKEAMDYYKRHNTTIFISFIDASKAFDRINHWTLFHILITLSVPVYIVRILSFWYSMQLMKVRWGGYVTEPFYVTNGVKQGGILSPALFILYIDDLSVRLSKLGLGARVAGHVLTHLGYADDLCLLSLTGARMQ